MQRNATQCNNSNKESDAAATTNDPQSLTSSTYSSYPMHVYFLSCLMAVNACLSLVLWCSFAMDGARFEFLMDWLMWLFLG
jgi:hypothetical protein